MLGRRVLVVDDDDDMLECLEIALSGNFQTATACGGARALELLASTPFDVVVLDLMMPEIDGFAVVKYILERRLETRVILTSALPELSSITKTLGVCDSLTKPYRLDALKECLERHLDVQAQHDSDASGATSREPALSIAHAQTD